MIEKYLYNQAKIGLNWPWIVVGIIIFTASLNYGFPSQFLLSYSLVLSIALGLVSVLMIAVNDKYKYLLYFVIAISVFAAPREMPKSHVETIQLASLLLILSYSQIVITLRVFRYISVKRNYSDYADQSLLRAIFRPDYDRGFTLDSRARDAVEKVLRIRKRHTVAADMFGDLLDRVEEYKKSDRVTLRAFREIVTNSNLKISQKQFNLLFR